jgi:hypothetical protein
VISIFKEVTKLFYFSLRKKLKALYFQLFDFGEFCLRQRNPALIPASRQTTLTQGESCEQTVRAPVPSTFRKGEMKRGCHRRRRLTPS